jgi:2-polyprenyl-6-methoxyphenol hydroxylase-like FAD-dependent oxidoreductase
VEERGIKVEFSAPVQTVEVEASTVLLRDGRKFKADLIVGADGEYFSSPFRSFFHNKV